MSMFSNPMMGGFYGANPNPRLLGSRTRVQPNPMKAIKPAPSVPATAGATRDLAAQAHQENAVAAAPGLSPQVAKVAGSWAGRRSGGALACAPTLFDPNGSDAAKAAWDAYTASLPGLNEAEEGDNGAKASLATGLNGGNDSVAKAAEAAGEVARGVTRYLKPPILPDLTKSSSGPIPGQMLPADPTMGPMSTAISAPPTAAGAAPPPQMSAMPGGAGAAPPGMADPAAGAAPPGASPPGAAPPGMPPSPMPPAMSAQPMAQQPMLPPEPINPAVQQGMGELMAGVNAPEGPDGMKFDKMVAAAEKRACEKCASHNIAPDRGSPWTAYFHCNDCNHRWSEPIKRANLKTGFEKFAWQVNTRSGVDRTSATGEGTNAGFAHRDDDYDKGPRAWANVGKYLKKSPQVQPDPFKGRHKSSGDRQWVEQFHYHLARSLNQPIATAAAVARCKAADWRSGIARFLKSPGARMAGGAAAGTGAAALENNYVFGDAVTPQMKKTNLLLGAVQGGAMTRPGLRGQAALSWPMKEVGILGGSAIQNQATTQKMLAESQKSLSDTNLAASRTGLEANRTGLEASRNQNEAAKAMTGAANTVGGAISSMASRTDAAGDQLKGHLNAILSKGRQYAKPVAIGAAIGVPALLALRALLRSKRKPMFGAAGQTPRPRATRITLKQPGDYRIMVDEDEQNALSHSEERPVRKAASATVTVPVRQCARCGGNHAPMRFEKLARAIEDAPQWTHWATCPTTGEPIILQVYGDEKSAADLANTAQQMGMWQGGGQQPVAAPPAPAVAPTGSSTVAGDGLFGGNLFGGENPGGPPAASLGKNAAINAFRKTNKVKRRFGPAVSPDEIEPYANKTAMVPRGLLRRVRTQKKIRTNLPARDTMPSGDSENDTKMAAAPTTMPSAQPMARLARQAARVPATRPTTQPSTQPSTQPYTRTHYDIESADGWPEHSSTITPPNSILGIRG